MSSKDPLTIDSGQLLFSIKLENLEMGTKSSPEQKYEWENGQQNIFLEFLKQKVILRWGGGIAQWLAFTLPDPVVSGSNPGITKKISEKICPRKICRCY